MAQQNKDKTVFQQLGQLFGPDGVNVEPTTNSYNIGKGEILKTQSKKEFDTAKLQAQQQKYIQSTWKKVDGELFQQSIHYETTRIGSYSDFENMEFYPEIAASLDTFAEECLAGETVIPLLNGEEYTIKELYDMNMSNFWVYAVDTEENNIKPSKVDGVILKGSKDIFKVTLDDGSELMCTDNHKWLKNDNSWVETKNLVPSDSLKLIKVTDYLVSGDSLESIKVTDYLNIPLKASTIGNHWVVSVEFVGTDNVYDLTNSTVHSNFGVKCNDGMVISHNCTTVNDNGEVLNIYSDSKRVKKILRDLFHNRLDIHTTLPMWTRNTPIREDSIIPLLNGDNVTIKELSEKIKNGEDIWTYAIQDETHKILPGKIIWCDLTRKNSELVRVTLDDGTHIDTTPDHEYILRNGTSARADSLKTGTSLMPFYTKISKDGYEKSYDPHSDKFISLDYRDTMDINQLSLTNDLNNNKFFTIEDAQEEVLNHKVVSVIKLTETSDVYCMEVVGPNGENDRHNFPVCSKDNRGNYSKNGAFLSNCKYGDNFTYLNIDEKKGIIGARQMPNFEMERRESTIYDAINRRELDGDDDDAKVKFFWKGRDIEFNSWQIAHFRLLGDDRRLPYGTCLKSDSYVKTSNGYKEIKDINIDDEVYSFDVKTQEKVTSKVLDKIHSGRKICYKLSTRHNYVDASEEHRILYYNTKSEEFEYKNTLDFNVGDLLVIDTEDEVGFILEPITSIEDIGEHETYDIYVENENHNFYANGIVVHNSLLEKARRIWKQLLLCVAKDTKVWTPNGHREIQDIKNGDDVYSYNHETKSLVKTKVKKCWKTGDDRKLYKVHTRYADIEVTDNHPMMVYNGDTIEYKNISQIDKNKDKLVCPTTSEGNEYFVISLNGDDYNIKLNESGLKHCKDNINRIGIIKEIRNNVEEKNYKNIHAFLNGDRRIKYNYLNKLTEVFGITKDMIKPSSRNDKGNTLVTNNLNYTIDEEFIRFFGFMLGDGWLIENGIGFALGEDESLNDFYIDYVKNKFNKHYHIDKEVKGVRGGKVTIYSKELKNIFKKLGFISGFDKKEIPNWIFEMNNTCKLALIRGLFDADGSDKWGVIGLSNKKLITQLKTLSQQVGLATGKISEIKGSIKEENGKMVNRKDTYKLYINWNSIENMRFENIISIDYVRNDEVWDLEVESDLHNFIANGLVVHNSEDAMLIYRVTRAPERRIFKIYVGNIDDADVAAYVDEIANRFKRMPVIDPKTGQVDLKYNQLAQDQDYFIPVRDMSEGSPIDTLPGADNLDNIADISYLQRKLFTALRTPKSFLGFEEAMGDGNNLALQDIRFSRTINRIQQSMLQELNKIAIVHLYLLGFEDELDNFTLSLNNPSTQAEMLKIENQQAKFTLYKDAVNDAGNGFGIMSMTRAKREILGNSNDEITQDLLEQRMEKAAASELENTSNVIKYTGMFDKVDKIYGDMEIAKEGGQTDGGGEDGEGGDAGGGGGGGAGFGGGGFGENDLDFGDDEDVDGEEGGGAAGEEGLDFGDDEGDAAGDDIDLDTTDEGLKKIGNLLTERKRLLQSKQQYRKAKHMSNYLDRLVESIKPVTVDDIIQKDKLTDRSVKVNDTLTSMISEIDGIVKEGDDVGNVDMGKVINDDNKNTDDNKS